MPTETIRLGSAYGNGRNRMRSTTLNTAVVAPMPSASVTHRKKWIAAKPTQRITNVLQHRADPPAGTLPLALVPGGLDPAKLDQRLAARFGSAYSSRYSECDCLFEMKLEFFIEFAVLLAKNQEAKARQEFRDHQDASATRPSTDPIAEDKRSQVASSASSCFLPFGVR
jgi:hypothetical protein